MVMTNDGSLDRVNATQRDDRVNHDTKSLSSAGAHAVVHTPYRPSNGTEGVYFFESWCTHCARDKPMSEGKPYDECTDAEICQIIAHSFAFDADDPRYPREWTYDADGVPCCTAFIPVGSPIPPPTDTQSLDMFADAINAGTRQHAGDQQEATSSRK